MSRKRLIKENPSFFIPLTNVLVADSILAEIGSIKAFQNANQLAKYCGIVWNDNDSGDFESEDSRMSKAGNRYLRYYIIEATGSVINHCPEYKAFYQKKYAETRNHFTIFILYNFNH